MKSLYNLIKLTELTQKLNSDELVESYRFPVEFVHYIVFGIGLVAAVLRWIRLGRVVPDSTDTLNPSIMILDAMFSNHNSESTKKIES